jgi:hypothetical protein
LWLWRQSKGVAIYRASHDDDVNLLPAGSMTRPRNKHSTPPGLVVELS